MILHAIESNRIDDFSAYKSQMLKRSWIGDPIIKSLHPGLEIRFDVCYISERAPTQICFSFFSTPSPLAAISCPKEQSSIFKFEIIALSDNAAVAKKKITISYRGNYKIGFDVQ